MREVLNLKKSNCKNCYKCIRHCPVKSIRFSAGQAHVVENECILCGQCFEICPQNAKQISSDIEKVRIMLMTDKVYVSIAPTFAAAFPGIGIDSLKNALVKLGFAGVEETALGATVVKREYERILNEEKPNVLISSCCTSVNLLIRKHYPDVMFALAPVLTPVQVHCDDLKRRYPDAKTVFIGPCIAKKEEAADGDYIDAVLSFEELNNWLKAEGIQLEKAPDIQKGGKTRLFPTTGGILATMEKNPEYTYIAVDGVEKCIAILEEIRLGTLNRCFIEMSACYGSCAGGSLLGDFQTKLAQNTMNIMKYSKEDDFEIEQPEKAKLHQIFSPISQNAEKPKDEAIENMLIEMGKENPEDRLNCGSCGYNTCREKAIAIIQGKAEQSMCLPFMMTKAEKFSDTVVENSPNGIIVLNDRLEVQKLNPVACKLLRVHKESHVLGEDVTRLMDPAIFHKVRNGYQKIIKEHAYLTEYDCYVERIILYNSDSKLFICIMRDVTEERRELEKKLETRMQAVEIADDVAKKQLKIVQDIASLLGETAADTLIAIEKLKETISDD